MSDSQTEQISRAERIETLLQEVAALPDPHVRGQMEELIQSLLDLFGDGLARIMELAKQSLGDRDLLGAFTSDDLIGSLLLLYGLHPDDLETRVARGVDGVRAYVESKGGSIELLTVTAGVAHVQLNATCGGCAPVDSALGSLVERAIYAAAPDLEGVHVEDAATPPPKLITVTRRRPTQGQGACALPGQRQV
jgi:Fe-S cluster biogenesis protein NfuA